jgi:putative sigma-54 modulation protein
MNIIVTGRHIEVTDALRARITEKVGKLSRYFDHVQKAQASLHAEPYPGRNQVAEVTLWADGVVLRGEEASEDMYASIDLVVDKLEKQLAKFRGKAIERRHGLAGRHKQQEAREALRQAATVEEESGEKTTSAIRIARRKRFELKPMTPGEAAVQMELLGHSFFMFRNAETLDINVVYRRDDGSYGLIEPEG